MRSCHSSHTEASTMSPTVCVGIQLVLAWLVSGHGDTQMHRYASTGLFSPISTNVTTTIAATVTTTITPNVTTTIAATVTTTVTPNVTTTVTVKTTTPYTDPNCQGSIWYTEAGEKVVLDPPGRLLTVHLMRPTTHAFVLHHHHSPSRPPTPLHYQVQVVDNYTITASLKDTATAEYLLMCADISKNSCCFGQVHVGYPPLDVKTFQCVSYNWQVLRCNWTIPDNKVQVNSDDYKPYLIPSQDADRVECKCETGGVKDPCDCISTCCFWRAPDYSEVVRFPSVIFQVSNKLSQEVKNFTHKIDNYAVVLPDPAEHVVASPTAASRQLVVNFSLPRPMEVFAATAGVMYRIDHRLDPAHYPGSLWGTNTTGECHSNQIEQKAAVVVEYWGQQYQVCVRLRSKYALDVDGWWSNCSTTTTAASPTVPDSAPVVGPGTFQVSNNIPELRDLTLAWQLVPPLLHNGPNFSYVVSGVPGIRSITVTEPFATFTNLSTMVPYRLQVVAENSEGRSSVTSVVKVEATSDLPDPPVLPVVVYHQQQHLYELRWCNREEKSNGSYMVYVCTDNLDTSQPCKADLRWINVGQVMAVNVTMENFNLTDGRGVRFAVSAESDSGASSGMTWDKCGTPRPYNTNLQPPTDPKSEDVRQTTAWVSWKLDCDNWAGVVESVVAKCCTGHHNLPQDCTGEEKEVEEEESEVWRQRVEVTGLKESTQYTVWLRLKYRSGISQWSLAQTFTTDSSGLSAWIIGLITTGAVVAAVILVFILGYSRRRLKDTMNDMTRELNIPRGLLTAYPKPGPETAGDSKSDAHTAHNPLTTPVDTHSKDQDLILSPRHLTHRPDFSLDTEDDMQRVSGGRGLSQGRPLVQHDDEEDDNLFNLATENSGTVFTSSGTSEGTNSSAERSIALLTPAVGSPQGSVTPHHSGYVVPVFPDDQKTIKEGPVDNSFRSTIPTPGYVAVQPHHLNSQENANYYLPEIISHEINKKNAKTSESDSLLSQNVTPGTGYIAVPPPDFGTHKAEGYVLLDATCDSPSHDREYDEAPESLEMTSPSIQPDWEGCKGGYVALEFAADTAPPTVLQGTSTPPANLRGSDKFNEEESLEDKSDVLQSLPELKDEDVQKSKWVPSEETDTHPKFSQLPSVGPTPGYVAIQPSDFGILYQRPDEATVPKSQDIVGNENCPEIQDENTNSSLPKTLPHKSESFLELRSSGFVISPLVQTSGQMMDLTVLNKSSNPVNITDMNKGGVNTCGYVSHPVSLEVAALDTLSHGSLDSALGGSVSDPTTWPSSPTSNEYICLDSLWLKNVRTCPPKQQDRETDSVTADDGSVSIEGQEEAVRRESLTFEDIAIGYSRVGDAT
ncbi:uncharacterized protein LOC121872308 isoform X1 [Homarus americanus]|uniref:uncharacterized protein LOC121872308 isoform X1 n=1 Tax=Homarus americanus TaxID=6706 RepID=UPI001C46AAF7|nr:uncharacterized protein LOC121872308 isoform X1 [Homarus americanus]